MSKPSTPKGTRDFGPVEMGRRNYIFDTLRSCFQLYGYAPIETPAMELTETLMGKYGEEGDRLIFRILNSGDFLKEVKEDVLERKDSLATANAICEKALRYDLTVPFARFVVQHQHEISFPFKRYQIQPVWRADRPQKGRYREFYQCDADVVGSDSLLYEVELVQLFNDALTRLRLPDFTIKINNRKVLSGIAEVLGEQERIVDITVAIDKLDKIGKEGVNKELDAKGVSADAIERLQPLIDFTGSNTQKLDFLRTFLSDSETGKKGIEELQFVFDMVGSLQPGLIQANGPQSPGNLELDITLARGLNYYTGAIFEVKANGISMGSICGGGRYDDLTGIFGLKGVSGIGISFGADRIYDVMQELNLFPDTSAVYSRVLIVPMSAEEVVAGMKVLNALRKAGISSEIYPEIAKMKKPMKLADDKKIPYVGIIGAEERSEGKIMLKDMHTGQQQKYTSDELIRLLQNPS